jgi:FAD-dependent urate hydroxylase
LEIGRPLNLQSLFLPVTISNEFPPGWDQKRVRTVIAHYEEQSEEEAVIEDEAALVNETLKTRLLIIGAGPFGLAMAAQAGELGIDYLIVGKPMDFWKANMPAGMYLRSASDWHLDPAGIHTIEQFLETQGLTPADVEPLSLQFYLTYTQWFQEQKQITVTQGFVQQLDYLEEGDYRYRAILDDSGVILAENVVIALGFKHFKHIPPELAAVLPAGRYAHTCDLVDFGDLAGKRCLIIGCYRPAAMPTPATWWTLGI